MSETKNGSNGSVDERRQHVRVQDAVGLHIQRLTDMPAAGQAALTPPSSGVRKRDKYEIEGYATVRRDHAAVAAYIDELEERIRELLLDGDAPAAKPSHKVSLSAGGIYFSDKVLLHPGRDDRHHPDVVSGRSANRNRCAHCVG